jgi:N-dimethylarginine dimethylaminohydrolase
MYPGLAKFFRTKKPVHIKTIYEPGKSPYKVYDNRRRGTTKVAELIQFLTKEQFNVSYPADRKSYPNDTYYTKGTTVVHIIYATSRMPHARPMGYLEQE